jgi:hypothetical protein
MADNSLAITLEISAPVEKVWAEIADWESQGKWMLQTKVWVTSAQREGVGTSISAFTGPLHYFYPRFKFLGVLDLMHVTKWEPPYRCDVEHVGKLLKGSGSFLLTRTSENKTRFDWSEIVVAPRPLFYLFAPFLYIGVRISLARFARSLSAR